MNVRQIVFLRKAFRYFDKNKVWILSFLFICSIIKECVWYACYGVNILSYISVQETFISFFNFFLIFVILAMNFILWSFITNNEKNIFGSILIGILKFLGIVITSLFYFFLVKKVMSIIMLISIFLMFSTLYRDKNYKYILGLSLFFLFGYSTGEPVLQYYYNKIQDDKSMSFTIKESNMDFLSFKYLNEFIDTRKEKYFLIGNTMNYFFIENKQLKKTLIIPKSQCKNIECEIFIFKNQFSRK